MENRENNNNKSNLLNLYIKINERNTIFDETKTIFLCYIFTTAPFSKIPLRILTLIIFNKHHIHFSDTINFKYSNQTPFSEKSFKTAKFNLLAVQDNDFLENEFFYFSKIRDFSQENITPVFLSDQTIFAYSRKL